MIFVGDIAQPYVDAVRILDLPDSLRGKNWLANLEGSIVENNNNNNNRLREEKVVYNDKSAIEKLLNDFNFVGFALANNHFFDTGSYHSTASYLKEKGIKFCGAGLNIEESAKPMIFNEGGEDVILLNFGWEVIQCMPSTLNRQGVNPLKKDWVIKSVKEVLDKYSKKKIVVFFHWSYELEKEPQPFERDLAMHLIDLGVSGVIGCHPHCIGGYENYKGKPIVYSLGNWLFKQGYYHNSKLKFPDFCNEQLAFEWDFKTGDLKFHFFYYNKEDSTLSYLRTETSFESMLRYTPFNGISAVEYGKWYKKHHYHKNKGLPIYYWNDGKALVKLKNRLNKIRDKAIYLLTQLK